MAHPQKPVGRLKLDLKCKFHMPKNKIWIWVIAGPGSKSDACPTGNQEVVGSTDGSGIILLLRLIMKYFLRPKERMWIEYRLASLSLLRKILLRLIGRGTDNNCDQQHNTTIYREFPLLRPPEIKIFYLLKTLFWKFKLFFSSFSTPSVHLIRDHLWDCPKVVFKTTFGQSQRWS